jgi:hypothetical protein
MLREAFVVVPCLLIAVSLSACSSAAADDADEEGALHGETCERVAIVPKGGICTQAQDRCVDGTSCLDNCPTGVKCVTKIFTCHPSDQKPPRAMSMGCGQCDSDTFDPGVPDLPFVPDACLAKKAIPLGGICNQGTCADDLECVDNCDNTKECFVGGIRVCRKSTRVVFPTSCPAAPAKVAKHGVCVPGRDTCVEGSQCLTNCPAGTDCSFPVFTCQDGTISSPVPLAVTCNEQLRNLPLGAVCDRNMFSSDQCAGNASCRDNCPDFAQHNGVSCPVVLATCQEIPAPSGETQ